MRIRWTADAAGDLERICDHISDSSPVSALRVARKIYRSAAGLATLPHRGRAGWLEGTRELVLTPLQYLIVYRIKALLVDIQRSGRGLVAARRLRLLPRIVGLDRPLARAFEVERD
jgi:toxin ParE1/3/4